MPKTIYIINITHFFDMYFDAAELLLSKLHYKPVASQI